MCLKYVPLNTLVITHTISSVQKLRQPNNLSKQLLSLTTLPVKCLVIMELKDYQRVNQI